jgi:hypothetical protein
MKEQEVKALLCKIRTPPRDFVLQFTHRRHRRINGTYTLADHLIKINNLNFLREDALLYTAIHEYAHHLQYCARGKTSHNREFWTLFHDLLDEAIAKGLTASPPTTDKITEVETELRGLLREHADIEVRIAERMRALHTECAEIGVRTEFLVERRLQLPNNAARIYQKCASGSMGYQPGEYRNAEAMRLIATHGDAAEIELRAGKTLVQAQSAAIGTEVIDPYEALRKERDQLSRRIGRLEERQEKVVQKMKQMELAFDSEAECEFVEETA